MEINNPTTPGWSCRILLQSMKEYLQKSADFEHLRNLTVLLQKVILTDQKRYSPPIDTILSLKSLKLLVEERCVRWYARVAAATVVN